MPGQLSSAQTEYSRLGESLFSSSDGVNLLTTTVTGALSLDWDSPITVDEVTGERKIKRGLSGEVWDGIHMYTGIAVVHATEQADTWGTGKVSDESTHARAVAG